MAGLMVAADSPAGRAAEAINDLTRHLPQPGAPAVCPTCAARFWPCTYFYDAAHRMHNARLRVGDVVPLELHPRLWPPPAASATPRDSRAWPPEAGTFGEEHDDG
ncbi:hypothetical protein [Amycolatopsis sp. NPDC051061]|uniref:hypothetical protein n=1 Tax=Amycolatopsis sp. NPDC051061 TaxID=3155042 RepID=UPI00344509E6